MNTEILKIAICDDERLYRKQLIEVIREYCKSHEKEALITEYSSGEECLLGLDDMDILFLDIDMKGIDGIQVKERMEQTHEHVVIIFITNYGDRISEAFGMQVVSFIQKPITIGAVTMAMDKILKWYSKRDFIEIESISGKKEVFSTEQIYYIEADNQYSKIKLRTEEFLLRKSLNAWEEELKEQEFCRIHQSVIINFAHVKELGQKAVMEDNRVLPISTRKRKKVNQAYSDYIKDMLSGDGCR